MSRKSPSPCSYIEQLEELDRQIEQNRLQLELNLRRLEETRMRLEENRHRLQERRSNLDEIRRRRLRQGSPYMRDCTGDSCGRVGPGSGQVSRNAVVGMRGVIEEVAANTPIVDAPEDTNLVSVASSDIPEHEIMYLNLRTAKGLEGLYEKLGPIFVTTDRNSCNPSQNSTFYTNHLLAYENNRMRIQNAVRRMPLYSKLIQMTGPNPTHVTLLELGMVTMGAPALPSTYIHIEDIRLNIGGFSGPADIMLVGAAFLGMLIEKDIASDPLPEMFPSFFTQSQDSRGLIRVNHGDIACFTANRLHWLPKRLIQVHAGSSQEERAELKEFVTALQRQTVYSNSRIEREFKRLLRAVLKKVNESLNPATVNV